MILDGYKRKEKRSIGQQVQIVDIASSVEENRSSKSKVLTCLSCLVDLIHGTGNLLVYIVFFCISVSGTEHSSTMAKLHFKAGTQKSVATVVEKLKLTIGTRS